MFRGTTAVIQDCGRWWLHPTLFKQFGCSRPVLSCSSRRQNNQPSEVIKYREWHRTLPYVWFERESVRTQCAAISRSRTVAIAQFPYRPSVLRSLLSTLDRVVPTSLAPIVLRRPAHSRNRTVGIQRICTACCRTDLLSQMRWAMACAAVCRIH